MLLMLSLWQLKQIEIFASLSSVAEYWTVLAFTKPKLLNIRQHFLIQIFLSLSISFKWLFKSKFLYLPFEDEPVHCSLFDFYIYFFAIKYIWKNMKEKSLHVQFSKKIFIVSNEIHKGVNFFSKGLFHMQIEITCLQKVTFDCKAMFSCFCFCAQCASNIILGLLLARFEFRQLIFGSHPLARARAFSYNLGQKIAIEP